MGYLKFKTFPPFILIASIGLAKIYLILSIAKINFQDNFKAEQLGKSSEKIAQIIRDVQIGTKHIISEISKSEIRNSISDFNV